jgi:hypothetical protein
MALDRTYFVGNLFIPGMSHGVAPSFGSDARRQQGNEVNGNYSLDWFIAKYEDEFLVKLLGKELFDAYKEGISAETPLDVWVELDKQIYREKNGFKFSPAANYVYFEIINASVTDTTLAGVMKIEGGDGVKAASIVGKQVKAWNDMCDMVGDIRRWIWTKLNYAAIFGDDDKVIGLFNHCHHEVHNEFRYINEFGI